MSRLLINKDASFDAYTKQEQTIIEPDAAWAVSKTLGLCPRHSSTPLHPLAGLALSLGVASMALKDESGRFGLNSFKALGAPYALAQALYRQLGDPALLHARIGKMSADGPRLSLAARQTACCASDGNHGKALAFAAQHFGLDCVVYVHDGVSLARQDAIRQLGARVEVIDGNYDDSVDVAVAAAQANGWLLIADTSADIDDPAPRDVMRGYTILVSEAMAQAGWTQAGDPSPWTHVFVQAGVGGLAAAVAAVLTHRLGADRPKLIAVEPEKAACVLAAFEAGKPVRLEGDLESLMGMLSCGEISAAAWPILSRRYDYAMTIDDDAAIEAMRRVANPVANSLGADPACIIGESGVASIAGAISACNNAEWRKKLSIDANSRILAIGTEGPTDPEQYHRIMAES
jgi:diaminopropionate ammonia-lyase